MGLKHTPSHYLRWLVLLIGDLHQPLHWLREHNYGADLKVRYEGKEFTLLEFWEKELPKRFHELPSVEHMENKYKARVSGWEHQLPTELFREWAKETADVVCHQVYAAMEVKQDDGSRKIQKDKVFELPPEIFLRWLDLAQDLTELGSQRLAFVLLDVLEHYKHKQHHKDGRGRHHHIHKHRSTWLQNLGKNAGIAAILVPALLISLCLLERRGARPVHKVI